MTREVLGANSYASNNAESAPASEHQVFLVLHCNQCLDVATSYFKDDCDDKLQQV